MADNWLIWRIAQLAFGAAMVVAALVVRHLARGDRPHMDDGLVAFELPYVVAMGVGCVPVVAAVMSW